MPKLIIILSGKKQSGKSSTAKYIASKVANYKFGTTRFKLNNRGDLLDFSNKINIDYPCTNAQKFWNEYGLKLYSFADPLKHFCMNVFGLTNNQCYGVAEEKNSHTHLKWEDQFDDVRLKYSKMRKDKKIWPKGYMTAREVLEVVGTDWCRRVDINCWAQGTYNIINNENYDLAIICDARFPNEISIGTEIGAMAIRLTREIEKSKSAPETALDNFPMGEYHCVINNNGLTLRQKNKEIDKQIIPWLERYGILCK